VVDTCSPTHTCHIAAQSGHPSSYCSGALGAQYHSHHAGYILSHRARYAEIGPERIGGNQLQVVTRYGKIVDSEEKFRIRNIQIGPLSLLLNQPLEGKTHQQEFLDKNSGDGINHIAFRVDDLKNERAKLVAKGIQIMFEVEGNCYFDTREYGNVVIQLMQRK